MKQILGKKQEPTEAIVISMRVTAEQHKALQKAWQRTGEYSNRSQWIKDALNSYSKEAIFE